MRDELEQRIRERAYHLWRENGCRDGHSDRHWLTAEREVLAAFAATVPSTKPRDPRSSDAKQLAPVPKSKSRAVGGSRRRAS